MDPSSPFEVNQNSSFQQQTRRVPNLKSLKEMIKKNSATSPSPSQNHQHVVLKSERTMKNEEECSFTLTDDDDRDQEGNLQRRSSLNKRPRQKSESAILIQEQAYSIVEAPNEDNEDEFLKELENENKMLEEELKNLQNNKNIRASSTSQPRAPLVQQNSNGANIQRKIRFQDEQENLPKSQRSLTKNKTPKQVDSPYQSSAKKQQNLSGRSRSQSNQNSPAPPKQGSNTKPKGRPTQNFNASPISNAVPQSINNTYRSFQSGSPGKVLKNVASGGVLRESQHNFNPNQPSTIEFEKYKSLELRLMGCMRTIKTLEKENQSKSDRISSLSLELEKKTKALESLSVDKTNLSQTQHRLHMQQSMTSNAKKKEREQEQKLKEQEQFIQDQKKQLQRFQELNRELLQKVKDTEQNMLEREGHNNIVSEEVSKVRKEIQSLRSDKTQLEQQIKSEKKKNEYLERESQQLKDKYDMLKQNSLAFERSSEALYQSHYQLTEKLKYYLSGQYQQNERIFENQL